MKKLNSLLKGTVLLIVTLMILSIVPPRISMAAPSNQQVPYGPWVDEIDFFQESDYAKVVDMLLKGKMDAFLFPITDPTLFAKVRSSSNLRYVMAYGYFNDLAFNPAPFKNGELNPFVDPKIREAMNYIIDRNYIVNEIYHGLAKPKYVSYISAFPEYGRLIDVIKLMEAKYKYNFQKGKEIVYEEMGKLGATLVNGKWYYHGKPVVIKIVIRIEDERKLIGDYFASQLEKLGFTVDRLYKSRTEAGPIVFASDPTGGKWNVYTGGWVSTAVSRDDSGDLGFFYTPLGYGAFMKYTKPDPIEYEVAKKLWDADYKNWTERMGLMKESVYWELKDSLRVWVVDQLAPFVSNKNLLGAADLSGGFTTDLWSRTVRWKGKVGGSIKAGSLGVLVDPWNPVSGTNWLYDAIVQWCVNDYAFLTNPYTGLPLPNRVVNYTIIVSKNVKLAYTKPYVKVVSKIEVPTDAWYGWDVEHQKLVYAPPGTYAKAEVIVNYGDVIGHVKYHDGSVMSLADWVALWPLGFERALDKKSPLYDESAVPGFQSWRKDFRGRKILSVHPLVIAYYTNYTNPEPDFIASHVAGWPNVPWQVTTLGIIAEEKAQLAFSDYKAGKTKRTWMNYIGGPSLSILAKDLEWAIANKYIPFKSFASKYITPDEAIARYNSLKAFYGKYHHFWVASGPFYLYSADFVAHEAVVKAFREYSFTANKWSMLSTAPKPEVSISVPTSVVPGLAAKFNISVTYSGKPYPSKHITEVKYIVLDSSGNLVTKGLAKFAKEGLYTVEVPGEITGKLSSGTYTIMVVASSDLIATPGLENKPFLVIPVINYYRSLLESTTSKLNAKISSTESAMTSLENRINSLQGTLNSLLALAWASIIIALIAIGIAVYAIAKAKKPVTKEKPAK